MSVVVGSDDVYGAVLVTTFTIIATYVIKCLHEIVCTLHAEHNLRWSSAFRMHLYCCFLLYIFQHRQEQIALAFSLLKKSTNKSKRMRKRWLNNDCIQVAHMSLAVNDCWLFTYVNMEFIHRCLTFNVLKDRRERERNSVCLIHV